MRNKQIYKETNTPAVKGLITVLTLNSHSRLPFASGALLNKIGKASIQALNPRLPQYVYIFFLF